MEPILDRLRYIASDVQELIGAVAFGHSRLQHFYDELDQLECGIHKNTGYRHYRNCAENHRNLRTKLHTTLESITSWRSLALQYQQELNEIPCAIDHACYFILHECEQEINRLIKDLHLHLQQLQQMQARMQLVNEELHNQKRELMI